jgi:hypothetical protein
MVGVDLNLQRRRFGEMFFVFAFDFKDGWDNFISKVGSDYYFLLLLSGSGFFSYVSIILYPCFVWLSSPPSLLSFSFSCIHHRCLRCPPSLHLPPSRLIGYYVYHGPPHTHNTHNTLIPNITCAYIHAPHFFTFPLHTRTLFSLRSTFVYIYITTQTQI